MCQPFHVVISIAKLQQIFHICKPANKWANHANKKAINRHTKSAGLHVTCPAPLWLCKAVLVSTSNAEPTPKYIAHPWRVPVYTQHKHLSLHCFEQGFEFADSKGVKTCVNKRYSICYAFSILGKDVQSYEKKCTFANLHEEKLHSYAFLVLGCVPKLQKYYDICMSTIGVYVCFCLIIFIVFWLIFGNCWLKYPISLQNLTFSHFSPLQICKSQKFFVSLWSISYNPIMALPINIETLLHKQRIESNRIEFKKGWNPDD